MNLWGKNTPTMVGVMNDTKWDELRLAMYGLGAFRPQFWIKDLAAEFVSAWDSEWFYHFRELPYSTIEWVELRIDSEEQRSAVRIQLQRIHLPGIADSAGFRIQGWVLPGTALTYIE